MDFKDVPPEVIRHYQRISGALNTPELKEFQSVEHFLIEVQNRISQAKSLTASVYTNLCG